MLGICVAERCRVPWPFCRVLSIRFVGGDIALWLGVGKRGKIGWGMPKLLGVTVGLPACLLAPMPTTLGCH